jgi:hypothetical protein
MDTDTTHCNGLFLFYRCRNSRDDNLDSVGASPPTMDAETNSHKGSPRNGREYWGKMPEPQNGHVQEVWKKLQIIHKAAILIITFLFCFQQDLSSPTSTRKDKNSPNHSRRSTPSAKTTRTKGVPQSFGYIKRPNGTTMMTMPDQSSNQQATALMTGGRTAHVSAVPRSHKLKISGGTQTTTSDFPQSKQKFLFKRYRRNDVLFYIFRAAGPYTVPKLLVDWSKCSSVVTIGERKVWIRNS